MYSYYLERGHSLQSLLCLNFIEKKMYLSSMRAHIERREEAMEGK